MKKGLLSVISVLMVTLMVGLGACSQAAGGELLQS